MERVDLTGAVLDGRYRVIEPVAEGAMGVIYRAERLKLGRIVAVKVLHDVLPNELSARKRFEIEAMAMAKLEHPHVAAVIDVGVHDDRPFVVMEFISGVDLKDVIETQAPLAIPRAVELVRQILSGLGHAHEHGIIHRDIKPANLVLSQKSGLGEHVKILDFGLARLSQDSSLTTGIVVGTPSYMAPEQIRGTAIDGRVDLYACGVLLVELLTGHKPFVSKKDDPIEVCSMHLKVPPPRLADLLPGVDFGELEGVVAKALAKSADARFATAAEFAAALEAIAPRRGLATPPAGLPVAEPPEVRVAAPPDVRASAPELAASAPSPARAPVRSRRRLALAGAAVAAVAAVIIVAAFVLGGDEPEAAAPPDAAPVAPAPGDPAGDALARIEALIDSGQKPAALELALAARKVSPRDPQLALVLGKLSFDRFYWTDGLRQFRDAIRLDPRLRTDPDLIKTVLRGFLTTPRADAALAGFLRDDIGAAARPYLQETATAHPNAGLRARAAAELKRYR